MWKPTLPPQRKNKSKIFNEIAKTGEFIYQIGDSDILREPSKPVALTEVNSGIFREKLGYLKQCLLQYRKLTGMGRGISAVQIGIPERFVILYTPELEQELTTVINPVISKQAKKRYFHMEMCMSAAPLNVPLVRPAWIEFTYYDEQGTKQFWKIKDDTDYGKTYNRVAQHEIDHLDGIINIDRIESKKLMYELGPSLYKKTAYEEI